MSSLGLFGGTFDPIHLGHLRLAEAFRDELALDEVRLIPAGQPYHRAQGPAASAADRLTMTRLAIEGLPRLCVDDRETRRERPAYTIDTLEEIRADIGAEPALWLLIGGDSLAGLGSWRRWTELFSLANIAVALRPGFSAEALPEPVRREWLSRQVIDFPNSTASGTMRPLALPPRDISATDIRRRLRHGDAPEEFISAPVLAYIRERGLYL